MRASSLVAAFAVIAFVAGSANAQRPKLPQLKGFDVQQILEMKARAESAQNGQGKVAPGDLRKALSIASQLGLSPEDLAAKIKAQGGGHPALKGMSKAQLSEHIRALARKHGQDLNGKKANAKKKSTAKKAALTKDYLRDLQKKKASKARKLASSSRSRKSTATALKMRRSGGNARSGGAPDKAKATSKKKSPR